jgi:uncharacterized protein with FMN-binding domain
MKRAPILLAATAAGLAGVLSFHSHRPSSTVAVHPASSPDTGGSAATTTPPSTAGGASAAATPSTTAPAASGSAAAAPTTTPATSGGTGGASGPTTTTPAASSRSATGQDVQFQYGDLSVTVTEHGGRITDLQMASLNENDPRSVFIDNQAIPLLRQQVLAAQSANIDGVSGATFTSQAYAQSVQSALDQLGIR